MKFTDVFFFQDLSQYIVNYGPDFFLKRITHIIIQKKKSHVKRLVEPLVHFEFNSFPEVLLLKSLMKKQNEGVCVCMCVWRGVLPAKIHKSTTAAHWIYTEI